MFIWLIIIGIIIYYYYDGNITFTKKDNATSTLDNRLAQGEISIEDYNEIKSILKQEKN